MKLAPEIKSHHEEIFECPWDKIESTLTPNPANRLISIDGRKVARIAKSMRMFGFCKDQAIIVDSSGIIRAGHTRRAAALKAKVGVFFKINDHYDLKEQTTIDDTRSSWSSMDWILVYARENKGDYPLINEFMNDNPHLTIRVVQAILLGTANYTNADTHQKIRSGDFSCRVSKEEANALSQQLKDVWTALGKTNKVCSTFAFALLMLFKHDKYKHDSFLNRVMSNRNELEPQRTRQGNFQAIFKIYNKGLRQDARIPMEEIMVRYAGA